MILSLFDDVFVMYVLENLFVLQMLWDTKAK